MKALITGAAGLIGSHLSESLIDDGIDVVATYFRPTIAIEEIAAKMQLIELDVREFESVATILESTRPAIIHHLAAQSLPTVSWTDPWYTIHTNVTGTVNLFEAIKRIRKLDPSYDPVVVVACSSAEYGASLTPERVPIDENAPLLPMHPYGVSKVGQDLLTLQYWINDRIRGVRARIFNCTGPRKQNDVVSDFGSRIVRVFRDGGTLPVGNLDTRRAIVDVRDMVSALKLLSTLGRAGEVYNICAENAFTIREILDMYIEIVAQPIAWEVDPKLLRPSDEPIIFGSTEKIRRDTGWKPLIPLKQTLRAVFEYEQNKLARESSAGKSTRGPIHV